MRHADGRLLVERAAAVLRAGGCALHLCGHRRGGRPRPSRGRPRRRVPCGQSRLEDRHGFLAEGRAERVGRRPTPTRPPCCSSTPRTSPPRRSPGWSAACEGPAALLAATYQGPARPSGAARPGALGRGQPARVGRRRCAGLPAGPLQPGQGCAVRGRGRRHRRGRPADGATTSGSSGKTGRSHAGNAKKRHTVKAAPARRPRRSPRPATSRRSHDRRPGQQCHRGRPRDDRILGTRPSSSTAGTGPAFGARGPLRRVADPRGERRGRRRPDPQRPIPAGGRHGVYCGHRPDHEQALLEQRLRVQFPAGVERGQARLRRAPSPVPAAGSQRRPLSSGPPPAPRPARTRQRPGHRGQRVLARGRPPPDRSSRCTSARDGTSPRPAAAPPPGRSRRRSPPPGRSDRRNGPRRPPRSPQPGSGSSSGASRNSDRATAPHSAHSAAAARIGGRVTSSTTIPSNRSSSHCAASVSAGASAAAASTTARSHRVEPTGRSTAADRTASTCARARGASSHRQCAASRASATSRPASSSVDSAGDRRGQPVDAERLGVGPVEQRLRPPRA